MKCNSFGESASSQREIILRNNGTISALDHFQSTGAENAPIISPLYRAAHIYTV